MATSDSKPASDLWARLASSFFLGTLGSALLGFAGTPGSATGVFQILFFVFFVLLILSGQLSALRKPRERDLLLEDDLDSPEVVLAGSQFAAAHQPSRG
jgi:uncharacterized membrane protein YtjA (UPF0391 family)